MPIHTFAVLHSSLDYFLAPALLGRNKPMTPALTYPFQFYKIPLILGLLLQLILSMFSLNLTQAQVLAYTIKLMLILALIQYHTLTPIIIHHFYHSSTRACQTLPQTRVGMTLMALSHHVILACLFTT